MEEIDLPQEHATIIFEDNEGAYMVANAGQSTKRTRHMDNRHFAIQDWVEEDLVLLEKVRSPNNSSDTFTKNLARTAYYKCNDVVMGRIPPSYYEGKIKPIYNPTSIST